MSLQTLSRDSPYDGADDTHQKPDLVTETHESVDDENIFEKNDDNVNIDTTVPIIENDTQSFSVSQTKCETESVDGVDYSTPTDSAPSRSAEENAPMQTTNTNCTGVAALGLYCSLQELMGALSPVQDSLRTQIYYTYISATCTHPVPIDEVVLQHVWQLVLAGSSKGGSTGAPLIGCLAGALEEVGQFLQTRYSTGFLHSSHYRTMLNETTAIGYAVPSSISPYGINESGTKSASLASSLGPPCTLQQQLQYSKFNLALHQERYLYKGWAAASVAMVDATVSEECLKEAEEAAASARQLETHLHTLQVWMENLGKWRVHVQSVGMVEEKDNPEIILLVSLEDEESPIQDSLHPPSSHSSTPSPQCSRSPLLPPRSPISAPRSRSPAPPPKSPQPPSSYPHTRSRLVGQSETGVVSGNFDNIPSLSEYIADDANSDGLPNNLDSLKGAKSKSLSFEKEYSGGKNTIYEKSSTSLEKLPYQPERFNLVTDKSSGILPKSKGSLEKSSDSLKSKSSTGSLERLFGSLSKSSSCCSNADMSPSVGSAAEGSESSTFVTGVAADQYLPSSNDVMDGWVIVKRLAHFSELHKKLW